MNLKDPKNSRLHVQMRTINAGSIILVSTVNWMIKNASLRLSLKYLEINQIVQKKMRNAGKIMPISKG
jgi:hypothetical protein